MSVGSGSTLLVLGLGNVLCGDDGLGVRAIECLERDWLSPPRTRVVDGGTLGLALLAQFRETDDVILVDAIQVDAEPGTLVRLDGDEVEPAARRRLSVHQVGVADLLDGLRLLDEFPRRLVLVGMVPASMELSVSLTPRVEASLPALVAQLVDAAGELGYRFRRKERDETRMARGRAAASVAVGV